MKIALIAFTRNGAILCDKLTNSLVQKGFNAKGFAMAKYIDNTNISPLETSLSSWTKNAFDFFDAIVFIGACGICVRAIAPYIKDKTTDPAVVVIDEQANYVISLLSGHIGGANDLCLMLAEITNATPIISTATDINSKFAIDSWAKKNNAIIADIKKAKLISASILDNKLVGLFSDFDVSGSLPSGVVKQENGDIGICISLDEDKRPFSHTVNVIPKIVSLGIGCKKNTSLENIEELVLPALMENNISIKGVRNVCSIDIKKDEQGLIDFCKKYGFDFKVYKKDELLEVTGDFTVSDFVKGITGVDNVCERSAVLGSDTGDLIIKKTSKNGVTLAVALKNWRVCFEY